MHLSKSYCTWVDLKSCLLWTRSSGLQRREELLRVGAEVRRSLEATNEEGNVISEEGGPADKKQTFFKKLAFEKHEAARGSRPVMEA